MSIPNPDLFTSVYPDDRLHPQFLVVRDSPLHEAARGMVREIFSAFYDADGNFVEQFQTTGFDQRTFELYLFAMFREAGLVMDQTHDRPDFILSKDDVTICVEATTASSSSAMQPYIPIPPERTESETLDFLENELPIRFGSPLFSKLNKRYWELPHVAGKPLAIAIQNFHGNGSLMYGYSALVNYLYGHHSHWYHDEAGRLIITLESIDMHKRGLKEIPSGYFSQTNAEFISAVLFSNSGTMAKFHRMGHQSPHRSEQVRLFRYGTSYRYDPDASEPDVFVYEVGDETEGLESWAEGTVLIHNPRAVHPIPKGVVGAASEITLEDGQIVTTFYEDFHPFSSMTMLFPSGCSEEHIGNMLSVQVMAIAGALPSMDEPVNEFTSWNRAF